MAITTNGIDALAYIYNGVPTARWNYPEAIGSPASNPAGLGFAVQLDYSFPSVRPGYSVQPGFQAFLGYQATAAVQAMRLIEDVARVDFVAAPSGTVGEFTFAMSSGHLGGSGGKAFIPGYGQSLDSGGFITDVAASPDSGDVWLNREIAWTPSEFQPGNYGFFTLLHEIGHGLGLKHPFEGPNFLDASLDDNSVTLMSYTEAPRSLVYDAAANQAVVLYPTTPMIYDVLALQHLYGRNMATRSGNTSYRWDDKEELLETIWDGGGSDTIDCSNQTLTCRVELRDGFFSSISYRATEAQIYSALGIPSDVTFGVPLYNGLNNLAIAFGAVIENANGGSAADVIVGNGVANRLAGLGGKDVLSGLGGNDTLVGGAGADRLNGGTGRDVFDYNALFESGVTTDRRDVIGAFVRGQDKIDLSSIDANLGRVGDQSFIFVSGGFTAAQQVRFASGQLLVNTDADAAAEFSIQVGITGGGTLTASDLVL